MFIQMSQAHRQPHVKLSGAEQKKRLDALVFAMRCFFGLARELLVLYFNDNF